MKNFCLIITLLLAMNSCIAETPYIPKKLTDPNYNFKAEKIDCEKAMKDANPFIGTTIPDECLPPKQEKQEPVKIEQPQPKSKFGQLMNKVLEY